ncbi:MAG: glycerophosphodiester phosphodiesterase family protein [Bacteriovoracia bacterium]
MFHLSWLLLLFTSTVWAFDWQGHRGARGLYPENTVGAMEEALKYPVTTLELDVVVSKDNKVIVSHEPWMNGDICLDPNGNRISGKDYNIYKMDFEEIVKFNCGSLPYSRFPQQKKVAVGKPTLEKLIKVTEETLKGLNRRFVEYNIEIKSTPEDEKKGFQPDYKTFSDLVVKTIREQLPPEKFTIQSFDWRVLKYLHEKYPDVRLVALEEGSFSPQNVLKELGFAPYAFSPWYKNLSRTDVQKFHENNVKVIPWTVNDVDDMVQLRELGVDGIISDYPNLIGDAVSKKCKAGTNYFEGKCVTIPAHALPSSSNPGWICKRGYVQKRSKCVKFQVPKNAHLSEDGKTWECDEGYKRYRSKCVK